MILRVKKVNLSTGGPLVAVLNKEDAETLDLHALDRIKLKKNKKELTVVLDISSKGVKKGEIGLFDEVVRKLKVKSKERLKIYHQDLPYSIRSIKKKLKGLALNKDEINSIVKDIVNNQLSVVELTYFVSGCYINGLSLDETVYLTNAIVNSSEQIKFNKKVIADKHSIGGVPGNRTSIIVVPIVAAAGIMIPKTSSRSITSPAGTADTMETLSKVELSKEKIKKVVKKTNGCIVWGGTMDLASADDNLINVERPLSLDPEGILLSSIMAKKKAVNATHVIVDIPYGYGAKISDRKSALHLKKKFSKLGKRLGIKVKAVVTDGSQPIGNGIGPVLEAQDCLLVLMGSGPDDLRNKSLYLASSLMKMTGVKNARKKALEILESGKAYEKFKEIIRAQGKNINLKIGKYIHRVKANKSGVVVNIDNKLISSLARIAGAPKDKGSGIYLNVRKRKVVKKGEILFTIYAENNKKLNYAKDFMKNNKIVKIR